MKNTTLLILAAGMGSRYGGLKQMDSIGPNGETIIDYSLYDALRSGFNKIVFIIRKDFEEAFKSRFEPILNDKCEVIYVFQEIDSLVEDKDLLVTRKKPWGTGHAVLMAKDVIDEPFAVINADDYYGSRAFDLMHEYLNSHVTANHHCMMGYLLKNTLSENGEVSRGVSKADSNNHLTEIIERTKIKRYPDGHIGYISEGKVQEVPEEAIVSMNFWGFHPSIFQRLLAGFEKFLKEDSKKEGAEFFIPIVANELISDPHANIHVLSSPDRWFGVTYQEDKPVVVEAINELISQGIYPNNLWN